jgi:hypothetical protein
MVVAVMAQMILYLQLRVRQIQAVAVAVDQVHK